MGDILGGMLAHFAAAAPCGSTTFLGLLPWYQYLQLSRDASGVCQVTNFHLLGANSSLLLILLVLIDDLLRIAGLVAVIFVIVGGIKYITSQGEPGAIAKALNTIINALLGLAIALIAIQFVSFLGNQFGGGSGGPTVLGLDLSSLPNPAGVASGDIVGTILSVVFMATGALAFLFLVLGGYGYITSQGNPQAVGKAKNTILYALIGLVVAIVAQSIVSLAVSKI